MKKLTIIGAGISGLVTAYILKDKYDITILERNSKAGGLADYFKYDNEIIEKNYHYYLPYDKDIIDLSKELNLKIKWSNIDIAYFINNKLVNYNNIIDTLKIPDLSYFNKFRNLFFTCFLYLCVKVNLFLHTSAVAMLKLFIGKRNYNVLWRDLIEKKFHNYSKDITLNWLIYRIIRVSYKQPKFSKYLYGYFRHQTSELIEKLLKELKNSSVKIMYNMNVSEIKKHNEKFIINDNIESDLLISTIPLVVLKNLIKDISNEYYYMLDKLNYLNLAMPVFILRKKVTDYFWINISNRNDFLYPGVIEYTNLNKDMWAISNGNNKYSIIYFPYYYSKNEEIKPPEYYISEAIKILKSLNVNFETNDIINKYCFFEENSQPVSDKDFYKLNLGFKTPIKGLYVMDSALFQPEDRSISACIKLAKEVSDYLSI